MLAKRPGVIKPGSIINEVMSAEDGCRPSSRPLASRT